MSDQVFYFETFLQAGPFKCRRVKINNEKHLVTIEPVKKTPGGAAGKDPFADLIVPVVVMSPHIVFFKMHASLFFDPKRMKEIEGKKDDRFLVG